MKQLSISRGNLAKIICFIYKWCNLSKLEQDFVLAEYQNGWCISLLETMCMEGRWFLARPLQLRLEFMGQRQSTVHMHTRPEQVRICLILLRYCRAYHHYIKLRRDIKWKKKSLINFFSVHFWFSIWYLQLLLNFYTTYLDPTPHCFSFKQNTTMALLQVIYLPGMTIQTQQCIGTTLLE